MDIASKLANVLSQPCRFFRSCLFRVLRVGPIPDHIAFVMDGNRRYAKKKQLHVHQAAGHDAGFLALVLMMIYCFELGVKYVTAYAFSIDNFRRKPEEVQDLMDLMLEKVNVLTIIVNHFAVRVHFAGNLELLRADLRDAAKKLMEATAGYSNYVLTICIAYTSTDEIVHAIQESCEEKCNDDDDQKLVIELVDLEKHMYMAIAPDPDIVVRTGGENRLSNFLLWQSSCSHLCTVFALWPEIGFWHLVWVVLNFQRKQSYFEKKKKHM